jgi:hypothetical protein
MEKIDVIIGIIVVIIIVQLATIATIIENKIAKIVIYSLAGCVGIGAISYVIYNEYTDRRDYPQYYGNTKKKTNYGLSNNVVGSTKMQIIRLHNENRAAFIAICRTQNYRQLSGQQTDLHLNLKFMMMIFLTIKLSINI